MCPRGVWILCWFLIRCGWGQDWPGISISPIGIIAAAWLWLVPGSGLFAAQGWVKALPKSFTFQFSNLF